MKTADIYDYIDKQEKYARQQIENHEIKIDCKDLINILDNVSCMLKELDNEWVDVRDRLPNKTMSVLVTTEYVFQALYQSKEDAHTLDSGYFYITDEYGNYEKVEDVIAWKPLPQPYERKE